MVEVFLLEDRSFVLRALQGRTPCLMRHLVLHVERVPIPPRTPSYVRLQSRRAPSEPTPVAPQVGMEVLA